MHQSKLDKTLIDMRTLAHQIAAAWKSPKSGVDLIEEQRRSLMAINDASLYNGQRGSEIIATRQP
jgi:hypothetical protein